MSRSAFLSAIAVCVPVQMRQGRGRLGEEDSDVDIEGFDEDDDGKPKTPAPVSIFTEIPTTVYMLTYRIVCCVCCPETSSEMQLEKVSTMK